MASGLWYFSFVDSALCAVEEMAAVQHGLITRKQLLEAGITRGVIDRRLRMGSLLRVYSGVYRLRSAAESEDQALMVAVLAVSDEAVVSHHSAAQLWGLIDWKPDLPHVTTPTGRWRARDFHVHRSRDLAADHVEAVRHIPVTNPSRTILDLGATSSLRTVSMVLGRALRDGLTSLEELDELLADVARQGRVGVGTARKLVDERKTWDGVNESPLEDEFRRLIDEAGLPAPRSQFTVVGSSGEFIGRADFAYPEHDLVIEIDGFRFHSDPESFTRDRSRQNRLLMSGYRILRYTAQDLRETPDRVIADLTQSLF